MLLTSPKIMHQFAGLKTQLQGLFSNTADIGQAQVKSKLQKYGSPREKSAQHKPGFWKL